MSKVCVVGHVTSESIVVGGHRSDPTVGGTGFFSSFAYRKLGLDTMLVTKVAENDWADRIIGLIGFVFESDFTIFNSGAQRYRTVPWGQNMSTSAASAIRHPPLPSVQQMTVDSRQSSAAIPIDNAGEDLRDLILR